MQGFERVFSQKMTSMKINRMMMIAMLAIGTLAGCDDAPQAPSKEEVFLNNLNGQWTLVAGQVTVDQKEVTNAFKGMTITFSTGRNYAVINPAPPLWPAGGSFTLEAGSNGLFDIRRDDNVLVRVTSLTSTTVALELQYTAPSGRTNSVSGQYSFLMTK